MKSIRSECGRILRSAGTGNRSLPAILSTGEVARDGHTIDPKGWVYPSSVPFIDSHRDADGVKTILGNVTYMRTGTAELDSGDRVPALLGTVNYAPAEINPDAEVAYQLALAGYSTALSVSFIPINWTPATERGRRSGAMDISSAELLECSACAVPSDVNAKVLARAVRAHLDGRETRADRQAIARAIAARAVREDSPARDRETREDRAARARAIVGSDAFDVDEIRRRLLS
jgi:hypothetical protein